jgi:hypothetical protein
VDLIAGDVVRAEKTEAQTRAEIATYTQLDPLGSAERTSRPTLRTIAVRALRILMAAILGRAWNEKKSGRSRRS